jgi:uncharacterized protein
VTARKHSAVLVVAAIAASAAYALAAVRDPVIGQRVAIGIACLALPIIAAALRNWTAVHVCLALALVVGWSMAGAPRAWPLYFAGPLVIYGIVTLAAPPLRGSVSWIRRGRIDATTVALVMVWIALSSGALVAWFFVMEPDVSDVRDKIPEIRGGLLVLGCLVFATVNAAVEEVLWRGVLTAGLEESGIGPRAAIAIQAASFGVFHIGGIPRGWLGVAMATCYGVMMGIVRKQSGGLLAPFVAHIAADVTIFALVVTLFG